MKTPPPYYPNTTDFHCLQCCLRMGYEYFMPAKSWTMAELDSLSGHEPDTTSWMVRTYIETAAMGFETVVYDPVDYRKLAENPAGYIRSKFSQDYAEHAISLSDLDAVSAEANLLLCRKDIQIQARSYTPEEFKALLDQGFLIVTWVDEAVYKETDKACIPHVILTYDYHADGIIAHDPGGIKKEQCIPSLHLDWATFDKANKMNADGETGEMMAFRK